MKIQRQIYNLNLYRGDTIHEELQVLGQSLDQGNPDSTTTDLAYNITDHDIKAQIRRVIDGPIVIELSCSATGPTRGEILITSETPIGDLDLGPDGIGVWDLQISTQEATPKVYTAFVGNVTYIQDVTKAA